ncbi:MAG: PQQ-binding-like beta-propeller repeat protein [Acidimicrobiia bacterium]
MTFVQTRRGAGRVPAAVILTALAVTLGSCSSSGPAKSAPPGSRAGSAPAGSKTGSAGTTAGRRSAASPPGTQPGSDPSVLPGPVLIADEGNDRLVEVDPNGKVIWEFPRPGDLQPGETFKVPDDAFFTPDGKQIIATQEEDYTLSLIDVATHHIVWRYGVSGEHGYGPNKLWNPDDALVLPDGSVLTADIKHCRLLLIPKGAHAPSRIFGKSTTVCKHAPPARFGSPNGAFPMANGHYLVTEINGDWVDEMDLKGKIYLTTHPPGVRYPSDTNEVGPDRYLTVDFSTPGAIETFDHRGRLLWQYKPTGADALNKPSLAEPLANGDVIATDDHNHRVIVVDPRTNKIVWQYGVLGRPGRTAGLLDGPDGLDLAPPHSLLVRHAATMGTP